MYGIKLISSLSTRKMGSPYSTLVTKSALKVWLGKTIDCFRFAAETFFTMFLTWAIAPAAITRDRAMLVVVFMMFAILKIEVGSKNPNVSDDFDIVFYVAIEFYGTNA